MTTYESLVQKLSNTIKLKASLWLGPYKWKSSLVVKPPQNPRKDKTCHEGYKWRPNAYFMTRLTTLPSQSYTLISHTTFSSFLNPYAVTPL